MDNGDSLLAACSTDRQREIVHAYIAKGSERKAAKSLGVSRRTVNTALLSLKSKVEKSLNTSHEKVETNTTPDGFVIHVQSFDRIQSAQQAMDKAGVDAAIWMPIKVVANSWEVAIRKADKSIVTKPLWQVKVTCQRRVPESIEASVDALAERTYRGRLKWANVLHAPKSDPSTMVVGLVDHHFGKLCWEPETRNNYDLDIAVTLYKAAMRAATHKWRNENIDKIIIPIGNDFGHIDTRAGTTEMGTPQDVDGRYEKIAGLMEHAVIGAVEEARQVAPVDVIWVGGNHDPVTSMWLCRCIHWAFRSVSDVTVDSAPCPVKYRQFGGCLLGFAHGDAPKEKALKDIMPIERADDWAKSKACREWLTGHLHQQKKTERIGTHEEAGQVFRILPSLCGTDSWHYRHGFSMSRKATQNYLYSHKYGLSDISHYAVERLYAEHATA